MDECHDSWSFYKYFVNFSQPLQVFGLQKICQLALGLPGPEIQSGDAACLHGVDDMVQIPCPRIIDGGQIRPWLILNT